MNSGISEKWIMSVDGQLTFAGVLEEYYEECAKYWKVEATRKQYARDYNEKILPNLVNHDSKPIGQYTKESFDEAVDSIKSRGQGISDKEFIPYADSTIRHFRHLIEVVVLAASRNNLCDSVLWGSSFILSSDDENGIAYKKQVNLKKSLTVAQEIIVFNYLMTDPEQRGEEMGLLFMYALGLRNNEACGINFEDIKPMQLHPDCQVLWVYKTTEIGSDTLKSSGKTKNADRIIPIPDKLAEFLMRRRKFVEDWIAQNSPLLNVDKLPIACVGNAFSTRCASDKITAAGREMFRRAKLNQYILATIDLELINQETSYDRLEKDPSAYLLRRNFGTHMHILGLAEPEIAYVLGHNIEDAYENRNEYINEEKLYEIKLKMDQRPLLNSISMIEDTSRELIHPSANQVFSINGNLPRKISIKACPGKLKLHIRSREPMSEISVRVRCSSCTPIRSNVTKYNISKEYARTVNILQKYQESYLKKLHKQNNTL